MVVDKEAFEHRLGMIGYQLRDLTDGQLAEVCKQAMCRIRSVNFPDHVWSYFDHLTEQEGIR